MAGERASRGQDKVNYIFPGIKTFLKRSGMIEKSFERKFILRFTGIVLTGMGVIALLLYIAIPSSEIRHYADAIQSFIEADDALSGVIRAALIVESIVISGVVVLVAVLALT